MRTRLSAAIVGLAIVTVGSLGVQAQWQQPRATTTPVNQRMTGTYELDTTRGDDPYRVVATATRSLPTATRERATQSLIARLDPPRQISIERSARTITLASSMGPRTSFDADNIARNEQGPSGRTITTRASLVGNRLTVTTTGNRNSDYTVTFEPMMNGDTLLVTRRLTTDLLTQPVLVRNYYQRSALEPRWDVYNASSVIATGPDYGYGRGRGRGTGAGTGGGWSGRGSNVDLVPDGTRMTATLDTLLSSRTSQHGDRFTMTVRTPYEYEGARIDGVLSRIKTGGEINRGNDLRVNFTNIHLRNGRSAEFTALLDSVRLADGTVLRIDTEGEVRGDSRTRETIEKGAIGAGIGAIIGAITGDSKGAAIGAVIGGAGGAIFGQTRDRDLDLPAGTEVTVVVTTPRASMPPPIK
jgi:hypothetical protein